MNDIVETKEVVYIDRKYRIEIERDEDCYMDWDDLGDHLGTIYSNHRDWNPDKHNVDEILDEENRPDEENYVVVPIWMYEHSGMTIRACDSNPFYCPWDSGCAGLIACSKEKVKKEYGELSDETIKKAKDVMVAEIHELDLLYQGEVYGYRVVDLNDDLEEEEVESSWGYICEWNKLDELIADGEAVAIAVAKEWYRKNGIQLHIPFEGEDK